MNNGVLRFRVNTDAVAARLGQVNDVFKNRLKNIVQTISAETHAFLIARANDELDGFQLDYYLGIRKYGQNAPKSDNHPLVDPAPRHVRWNKLAEDIWVVQIDEKARWLEEGRPATSMATEQWLLKPGKVKQAADGSTYRSIPITQMKRNKPTIKTGMLGVGPGAALVSAVRAAASGQNIKLGTTEYHDEEKKKPKFGILHRLNVSEPSNRSTNPEHYSRPRSAEEADKTKLEPHQGHFKVGGAVVLQREDKSRRGGVARETVIFRTVSSKHQNENRWMYPEVKPLNFLPAALRRAEQSWEEAIKQIEAEFRRLP